MTMAIGMVEHLRSYGQNPQALEALYQEVQTRGEVQEFTQAVQALHTEAPDHLLFQAWFYRLAAGTEKVTAKSGPNWAVAIGLSLLSGFIFWFLSDVDTFTLGNRFPLLLFTAAPICALLIMTFLFVTQAQRATAQRATPQMSRLLWLGLLLVGGIVYVTYVGPKISASAIQDSYLELAIPHLALLAWGAIGAWLLWSNRVAGEDFAFLLKSFETVVVGGLFVLAGGAFTAISFGLFETLGISVEDWLIRIFMAGGGGLIPVLAVALTYDPQRPPQEQNFHEGISRLIATLMRLMLPLVLLLLVVYVGLIPFNFRQPFENRDVLIVYNLLLFAVIGLVVSATPIASHHLHPTQERWLRRGLLLLAGLAVLISLYALSAIGYRTWNDGFTPNRVTIIGWNLINIGLLTLLLVRQARSPTQAWLQAMYTTFAQGAKAYLLWAMIVLLLIPWIFMWASEPIKLWQR
jgi:hypothetical protein